MSKVYIVSSTIRKGGNSDVLCSAFARGAQESGNEVKRVSLRDVNPKFCLGCLACQRTGKCVIQDGVADCLDDVQNSDVLVFATPIYYYAMSGQLKTFLDRLNPLFSRKNKFKKVYLLATCADGDESALDGAIKEVEGWIACFSGVRLVGVVYGTGATDVGDVKGTQAENDAYVLGRGV